MSGRRQRIAIWLAATVAAAGLGGGGWYVTQVVSAFTGSLKVSCDEAAHFLRAARLPDGTHDRHCTTGQWLSISYELDFRAPRDAIEAWLQASYPGLQLRDCANADVCADVQPRPVPYTDKDGHRLTDSVWVELDYEDGGIAHARMSGATI
ncbi:hypothetical protein ACIPW5_06950 [Streptomyces sp. NPDC090077]|uniref:hypothetical protein n=1 Tax=Streptomyces sp. NPDC090077 TaxID=3365938 RepID=UPI003817657C